MTPTDRAKIAAMAITIALGVGAILTSPARSHDADFHGYQFLTARAV